jgi:hypothetical protein
VQDVFFYLVNALLVFAVMLKLKAVFLLAKFVSKAINRIAPQKWPPYLPWPPWVM